MKLSHNETKQFVRLVLDAPKERARLELHESLKTLEKTEGQFYTGIVEHGLSMNLTTDEWFELLSRLPNRILRSDLDLSGLLSEEQLKRLPPVTG